MDNEYIENPKTSEEAKYNLDIITKKLSEIPERSPTEIEKDYSQPVQKVDMFDKLIHAANKESSELDIKDKTEAPNVSRHSQSKNDDQYIIPSEEKEVPLEEIAAENIQYSPETIEFRKKFDNLVDLNNRRQEQNNYDNFYKDYEYKNYRLSQLEKEVEELRKEKEDNEFEQLALREEALCTEINNALENGDRILHTKLTNMLAEHHAKKYAQALLKSQEKLMEQSQMGNRGISPPPRLEYEDYAPQKSHVPHIGFPKSKISPQDMHQSSSNSTKEKSQKVVIPQEFRDMINKINLVDHKTGKQLTNVQEKYNYYLKLKQNRGY